MDLNWGRQVPVFEGPTGSSASSQFPPQAQLIESNNHALQKPLKKATAKDLDKYKTELASFYHSKTATEIRMLMIKEHKLDATEKQYKNRFAKWK
ncbi:hypothetical protein BKA65DRAFT_551053 [Rhexocercosporidium sp. MPI-PUGE-AT-0058]|nr:hypothetical protein BKA65DRAFT_551053 [Rhexocercosporidium sp. MPI-PUGE-AT-0058]